MADSNTANEAEKLPDKASNRLTALLDSYQGRYLLLATLLILALLAIAWFGHSYVSRVTSAQARLVRAQLRQQGHQCPGIPAGDAHRPAEAVAGKHASSRTWSSGYPRESRKRSSNRC